MQLRAENAALEKSSLASRSSFEQVATILKTHAKVTPEIAKDPLIQV